MRIGSRIGPGHKTTLTVRRSEGARAFCDASSLSCIDSLGTITVLEIFRGRYAPAAAFQRCALTLALCLLHGGHVPFGSGHGSEIWFIRHSLRLAYRAGVSFDVPSE